MDTDAAKKIFGEVVTSISDVDDDSFEITGSDFPLRTHVLVTDYYIQLGTMIQATGQGFRPTSKSRFFCYLNAMNSSANLAKLTSEADSADEDGDWLIMARAMIVSGSTDTEYTAEALSNILTLWHQDIASLIAEDGAYSVTAMLAESE